MSSSVLKWPDSGEVDRAVRDWAERIAASCPEVLRVGYFGSYARGDWGPGSDVDLIVIVEGPAEPLERRGVRWDATELPVPADVLVYTKDEWDHLGVRTRLHRVVTREAVWVYPAEDSGAAGPG